MLISRQSHHSKRRAFLLPFFLLFFIIKNHKNIITARVGAVFYLCLVRRKYQEKDETLFFDRPKTANLSKRISTISSAAEQQICQKELDKKTTKIRPSEGSNQRTKVSGKIARLNRARTAFQILKCISELRAELLEDVHEFFAAARNS